MMKRSGTSPWSVAEERGKAFKECDFDAILAIFPHLDFSALIRNSKSRPSAAEPRRTFQPLADRLANAAPAGQIRARSGGGESRLPVRRFRRRSWPPSKRPAAREPRWPPPSRSRLKSENPEWIGACLSQAVDLPPLLRPRSRAPASPGCKAGRRTPFRRWPEVFPDLWEIRLREDWDGWEQADFSPALENLSQCVRDELAAIRIPKDSTPEQRKAVADRLSDPATVAAVGKPRFAHRLHGRRRRLFRQQGGARNHLPARQHRPQSRRSSRNPACRAEALALTALGDFKNARALWVELITEHPVETHLPGDYAEAAYTAFENADPQQAVEILNTGIRRFPQDANFALRAGWVALLTGNSERAYKFLLAGKRIGFPSDKLENATALLSIAASQAGATDESSAYFEELLAIDPAWENPETLDTLDWPEELKSTLREFTLVALTPSPYLNLFPPILEGVDENVVVGIHLIGVVILDVLELHRQRVIP